MADGFKMVVVDGVRFRPEDAPKQEVSAPEPESAEPESKARTTKNKARTASDKKG